MIHCQLRRRKKRAATMMITTTTAISSQFVSVMLPPGFAPTTKEYACPRCEACPFVVTQNALQFAWSLSC
jgi:hypothetical protein